MGVICRTLIGGVLTLCRDAVGVFCSPSRLGYHSWEDKGVHTLPKLNCLEVNVLTRLEFELAYFQYYATGTTRSFLKSQVINNNHHHVVLVTRIFLTLSHHFPLSFIASGRSSGQHPVSSHNCWMYVRAGRPAFARPCVGVHKSTSLMSSSLLLQQCPACLVRLTWIVFVIGGRWPSPL